MFWDLLLLGLTFCYLVILYFSWNKNYWLRKGIPFVEPKFFFGNVKDVVLMRKTIGQAYQEVYMKLGDKPLGGFFKLRTPILMVKDPQLVKDVLFTKFENFQSNDIHIRRDASPLFKMNPLLASGATWRSIKSIWTPLLNDKTPAGPVNQFKCTAQKMVSYLQPRTKHLIEGKELSRLFIGDAIASWAIGLETDSFHSPNVQFRVMTDRIYRRNFKSNLALLFALYVPSLSNFFHFRIVSRRAFRYFFALITSVCKRRVKEQIPRDDFLQYLIDVNKESEKDGEGTVFNYDKIVGCSMNLFFCGLFKMSDPFYWSLYEISRHPAVQEKLRDELKASGVEAVDDLNTEAVQRLEYLEMVLLECFRLHPSVQSMTRICTKETTLEHKGLKYTIDVGTPVNVPIYALHMDPEHFARPDQFEPERFAQGWDRGKEFVYMPFGTGPRCCPGEKFAKIILKIGIASLLLNFQIRTDETLEHLEQDPISSLFNMAKGDVPFKFVSIS